MDLSYEPTDVSHALFGNMWFATVVVRADHRLRSRESNGQVIAREIAAETGIADPNVRSILHRLRDAGLLRQMQAKRGLPQPFVVDDEDVWPQVVALATSVTMLGMQVEHDDLSPGDEYRAGPSGGPE